MTKQAGSSLIGRSLSIICCIVGESCKLITRIPWPSLSWRFIVMSASSFFLSTSSALGRYEYFWKIVFSKLRKPFSSTRCVSAATQASSALAKSNASHRLIAMPDGVLLGVQEPWVVPRDFFYFLWVLPDAVCTV